jgi:hypothetical protein
MSNPEADLLHFGELLKGGVHALLQNGYLLILFIAEVLQFTRGTLQFE